jgi:antitoxin component YwqK of YwqJK toxin-antitoxin module
MKVIFCLLISFVGSVFVIAQRKEGFYDLRKRESDVAHTRYYYVIEYKDSFWRQQVYYVPEKKLYMFGTYLDSNCKREHGRFYYKYPSGQLETIGEFNDHKKQGVWLAFHPNGVMADSSVWKNGKKIGTSLSWYENGFVQDSSIYNEDESGISVTWFDNGNPASAGRYAAGRKMNGKWQFFHYNGKLSCVEKYDTGKLFQREFYDESGSPVTDTANKNQKFSFAGNEKSWSDFLAKNIDARVPANGGGHLQVSTQ